MSVIYNDQFTTVAFPSTDNDLILAQSGQITTDLGDAIDTAYGEAVVLIGGFVAGHIAGFFDTDLSSAADVITVSATGSLIGENGSGIGAYRGGVYVTNYGNIEGVEGSGIEVGAGSTILNSGSIAGFYYGIADDGSDSITNTGEISSLFYQDSTISEGAGSNKIDNSGTIKSTGANNALYLAGGANTVSNSGDITGSTNGITIIGGQNTIFNSGLISSSSDDILVSGSLGGTTVNNTGSIQALAPAGVAVSFADTDAADLLDNSGTIIGKVRATSARDTVTNTGVIDGDVAFATGGATVRNSGDISGSLKFAGDNNTYHGHSGSIEGKVYLAGSHGVYNGGATGTSFVAAAAELAPTLTINGSNSLDDALYINTAGTVIKSALKLVAGIEAVNLVASDTIAVPQHLASTGSSGQLTINAAGSDVIDLSAVGAAAPAVAIWGAGGSNTITAGADSETFGFATVASSTGPTFDVIKGVDFGHDIFDVSDAAGVIGSIDAPVTPGFSIATPRCSMPSSLWRSRQASWRPAARCCSARMRAPTWARRSWS